MAENTPVVFDPAPPYEPEQDQRKRQQQQQEQQQGGTDTGGGQQDELSFDWLPPELRPIARAAWNITQRALANIEAAADPRRYRYRLIRRWGPAGSFETEWEIVPEGSPLWNDAMDYDQAVAYAQSAGITVPTMSPAFFQNVTHTALQQLSSVMPFWQMMEQFGLAEARGRGQEGGGFLGMLGGILGRILGGLFKF